MVGVYLSCLHGVFYVIYVIYVLCVWCAIALQNDAYDTANITVKLDKKDSLYTEKLIFLGGKTFRKLAISRDYDSVPTMEIFSYLRVVHANEAEWELISAGRSRGKRRGAAKGRPDVRNIKPISLRNELKVLQGPPYNIPLSLSLSLLVVLWFTLKRV